MTDQARNRWPQLSLRRRPAASVPAPTAPEEPEQVADDELRVGNSSIVAAKVYVAGRVVAVPATLAEAFQILDDNPDAFAWIGLYRPTNREMQVLAREFHLNPLAVEDTITAHQRPKLERYEDTLFLVLRAARYIDAKESVAFGEVHAFIGERMVLTVRHSETPDLGRIRRTLEEEPDLLALGPSIVLLRLLDVVVDEYEPVVVGIENDLDEIETQVFNAQVSVSKRIYKLSRELIDFQRAVRPLRQIIETLCSDPVFTNVGERRRQVLRDIEDHSILINERVEALRDNLHGILQLDLSVLSQAQNEEARAMTEASLRQAEDSRRIAAWAGVLFVPSLITGTYGMNFRNMPELEWYLGYPAALLLMLVSAIGVYFLFKHKGWL